MITSHALSMITSNKGSFSYDGLLVHVSHHETTGPSDHYSHISVVWGMLSHLTKQL